MKNILVAMLMAMTVSVFGQKAPDFTLTFENNVKDLIVHPFTGITVVSEGNYIHGHNTLTGDKIWSKQVTVRSIKDKLNVDALAQLNPNAKEGSLTPIPGTSYVKHFDKDNTLVVVDTITGEEMFDSSSQSEINFYDSDFIYGENALLLKGLKPKVNPLGDALAEGLDIPKPENADLAIVLFSMDSKKNIWQSIIETKTFASLFAALDVSAIDKTQETDSKIMVLEKRSVFALDLKSGSLLWKDDEHKYSNFYLNRKGDKILLEDVKGLRQGRSELFFKNTVDGSDLWPESVVTKRLLMFEDWSNRMLLAHQKGFNFYDYETGEKVWAKDPKGKNVKKVISTGKDFLYVYDDQVMLIDQKGQKAWKRDVKISDKPDEEVYFIERTPEGKVLYVTASRANMIDYETGKKLWKGNLSLNNKRSSFTTYNDARKSFYLFNDEKFYQFDENSTDKPKPLVKLKLKNERLIKSINAYENSVCISGQLDVAGLDYDGNILFQRKYSQPGEAGRQLLKAGLSLAKVGGDAAASASIETTVTYRDADGNEIVEKSSAGLSKNQQKAGAAISDISGALMKNVANRFDGFQEDDSYVILFAKGDDGEKLLVKVNKRTGEEEVRIETDSNKPIYDYHSESGSLFYSRKNEVKVYLGE